MLISQIFSNNTPNAINILAYAEIVREKAILRELIAVGNRIAENSYSPKGKDIKMVLDEAEGKFLRSLKTEFFNRGPSKRAQRVGNYCSN